MRTHTLDDAKQATTLEDAERIARRVLGGANPDGHWGICEGASRARAREAQLRRIS